jgi:hypothetical protein
MLKKLAQTNVNRYVNHPGQSKTLSLGYAVVVLATVPVMLRKIKKTDTTP